MAARTVGLMRAVAMRFFQTPLLPELDGEAIKAVNHLPMDRLCEEAPEPGGELARADLRERWRRWGRRASRGMGLQAYTEIDQKHPFYHGNRAWRHLPEKLGMASGATRGNGGGGAE